MLCELVIGLLFQASFNLALSALSKEKNGEIVKLRDEVKKLKEELEVLRGSVKDSASQESVAEILSHGCNSGANATEAHGNERPLPPQVGVKNIEGSEERRESQLETLPLPNLEEAHLSTVVSSSPSKLYQDNLQGSVADSVHLNKSTIEASTVDESLQIDSNSEARGAKSSLTVNQRCIGLKMRIALNEFTTNDLVLLVYDLSCGHYKLFSVTSTPYFLHEDCYSQLGVRIHQLENPPGELFNYS